ncbi:radical SAM protein [candidate division WOR-3 bacterium]|nr:radical SAM protein [candidate division WOR-3 bacterium]
MKYKYLFGPVPSRRLGVSLGIDLIPYKTCTFDCIYCECGKTTNKTITRKEYIPTKDIIDEIKKYLKENPSPEYITFSGSGEPLLHLGIKKISDFLKSTYPHLKTALITNAAMFTDKKIRDSVSDIDLILPSLDSAIENTFQLIDRPVKELSILSIINGLILLRKNYTGKIWLEVFIIKNINDSKDEIKALKKAINLIKPDKVQLNTLDRPGTENDIMPASKTLLESIKADLDYKETEIISKYKSRKEIVSYRKDVEQAILDTVSRRPCTLDDLSEILGLKVLELNKYIDVLMKEKSIIAESKERGVFLRTPR